MVDAQFLSIRLITLPLAFTLPLPPNSKYKNLKPSSLNVPLVEFALIYIFELSESVVIRVVELSLLSMAIVFHVLASLDHSMLGTAPRTSLTFILTATSPPSAVKQSHGVAGAGGSGSGSSPPPPPPSQAAKLIIKQSAKRIANNFLNFIKTSSS